MHGGGAPHTFACPPPPHVWPLGQVPQSMMAPQPSLMGPQLAFSCAHVFGTHTTCVVLHWLGMPPAPHAEPVPQVPQLGVRPPQPSPTWPQFAFACAQVRGVQVAPPPH
jgi:hypothetical protein